jgi:hypothetical protein
VEFGKPGPLWMARRVQREGKRDHGSRSGRSGGTAGKPGPIAAAALDERNPRDHIPQHPGDLQPGRVLPGRRAWRPATTHPVRLGHPGNGASERRSGIPGGKEVDTVRAARGAMRQRQQE